MADNEINIFYQYNSKNEIDNPQQIKGSYLLVEYIKTNTFNYDTMKNLLINDGVDFQKIKRIYIEENHEQKILKSLSGGNFNNYKDIKDIYLHLELKEHINTQKYEINRKIQKYNSNLSELEKKYKEISEEMKKIKNSNLISDEIIYDIIKKKEEEQIAKMNNQLRSSIIRLSEGKKDIYVLYLFCSLFDLKAVNYEENEYFEEIKCIYNLFKSTLNISAELRFEPLINLNDNNFKDYFENIPDIIHININSIYLNEELSYNNLGETINTKYENILENLGKQKDISKVKLLILSSDKNGKIKDHFKKIKNIIYLTDLKKQQCENKTFYQDFYSNILKRFSIEQAFEKSYHVNFSKKINTNQETYILSPTTAESDLKKYKNRNNIVINDNCSLKLDFLKYNYHSIFGRNLQIKNCIEKIQEKSRNILVYGGIGAGKKSLVQTVGKYFFERGYFSIIEYIELYDLDNIEEILTNKIEQIDNEDTNKNEDEIATIYSKKILLIINFNFLIDQETKFGNIENAINTNKNKYKNIIFLYTCTVEKISSERMSVNKASIKLDRLRKKKDVLPLLNHIVEEIFDNNKERDKIKNFLKLKKISEYPNYFFLIALYFKKIGVEKTNINNNTLKTAEYLLNEFFKETEDEYKLKKISSIFYILNLGIRDDILKIFFTERDIKNIKTYLKYIIRSEGDSEGNNYLMDDYFRHIFDRIYEKENSNEYLLIILETYAKVFRYIVSTSDFPYDLCKEFHAGINKGIWFSMHDQKFKKIYDKFCSGMSDKKLYFDDIRYFNNIKIIFENKEFINIIKTNIDIYKEYISQIIICFPTILYFINNNLLLKKSMDILEGLLKQLKSEKKYWKNEMIRFLIFKYWISNEPDDFANIKILSEKKDDIYEDVSLEIELLKIYDMTQEKTNNSSPNKDSKFGEKMDCFNLIRLNILLGKVKNYQSEYFQEANEYAKKINNKMLIKLTLLELAECYLINSCFDEFNKCVLEYQTYKDSNKDKNDKFDIKLNELIKTKNEKYKNGVCNKLYFYTSELFFEYEPEFNDENMKQTSLKTEANNSFYLKYNLKLRMRKEIELIFKNIKEDFLNELNNIFQNPSKFIYIGCDYFNPDGQLFYLDSDDYRTKPISKKDFENTIKECKNKPEMIILWFINSEIIAKCLEKNNFQNIIFLKQSETLMKLLKRPYFYFYFQRCLYKVIADFIVKLDKKSIKDNFIDMEKDLTIELNKFIDVDRTMTEDINSLLQQDIISCKKMDEREDRTFFDDMNVSRNNSLSNININIITNENDSKKPVTDEEFYGIEKKIDFQKLNLTNMKFDDDIDYKSDIFCFLVHKRYYGKKHLFCNVIKCLIKYRIINIYGRSNTGKTALCMEICKYFLMNNFFKNGIYYYSNCKFKDLKNKQNNDKENRKTLIILDDESNLNNCSNFLNNPNSYFIIVSTECLKKILEKNKENKNKKRASKKNSGFIKYLNENNEQEKYINANLSLSINFREEFYNYMKIKLSIFKDSNIAKKLEEKNSLKTLKYKDQVFIDEIIELFTDK